MMQPIQTEIEFQEMLAKEQAIALVCFEWSGQSKVSEQVVKKWEQDWLRQSQYKTVPLYRISPDDTSFLQGWIAENARSDEEGMESGFGSALWVRNGKVVHFIRYAAKTGAERLSQITEAVFTN